MIKFRTLLILASQVLKALYKLSNIAKIMSHIMSGIRKAGSVIYYLIRTNLTADFTGADVLITS